MDTPKKGLSGYYATTFLIGLGFFTMGLMDPLYDNYVPVFLGYYLDSSFLVGLVMTLVVAPVAIAARKLLGMVYRDVEY